MKRLFIIAFLFVFVLNINAKDKYTPYKLKLGAYLNHNIYNSGFRNFPGYELEGPSFEGTSGQGFSFSIGAEYAFAGDIFGIKPSLSFDIGYSDLSALFSKEYRIGNIIDGDSYTDAISEFRIDPTLTYIMTGENLLLKPANLPLGIMIGTSIGFPIEGTFTQGEQLVQPESGYNFETGTNTRNEASGDIPDLNSIYFGLNLGVYADLVEFGDFDIVPEIKFTMPLTNVTNSVDWKAYYASAGLSLKYNVPKAKAVPPLPPPIASMPEPPLPPEDQPLNVVIGASRDGEELGNWSIIKMPVEEYIYNSYYSVPPVVYFEDNSDNIIPIDVNFRGMPGNTPDMTSEEIIRKAIINSASEKIDITLSNLTTDKDDIKNARSLKIQNIAGISESDIKVINVDPAKLNHKEIIAEATKAEIRVSQNVLVESITTLNKEYKYPEININVTPDIEAGAGIQNYYGEVFFNSEKLFSFYEETIDLELPGKLHNSEVPFTGRDTVTIYVNVLDEENKRVEARHNILIDYDVVRKEFFNIPYSVEPDSSVGGKFILGYFKFDNHNFEYVDKKVLAIAQKALKEGKTVIIHANTDNLGSQEYNRNLALKRAGSAKKLLGDDTKVITEDPESAPFSNDSPYGRMLNRNVVIEIR